MPAASLDQLHQIPVLNDDMAYLVVVGDVGECPSRLEWWKGQGELPGWPAAECFACYLLLPNVCLPVLRLRRKTTKKACCSTGLKLPSSCHTTMVGGLCHDSSSCTTILCSLVSWHCRMCSSLAPSQLYALLITCTS